MARVLSIDEVRELPFNSLQWMEFYIRRRNGTFLNDCYKQYFLRGHMASNREPYYNYWWRVWDSQPTLTERKEAEWKCQI